MRHSGGWFVVVALLTLMGCNGTGRKALESIAEEVVGETTEEPGNAATDISAGDNSSPDIWNCLPDCGAHGESECGSDGCGGTCGECEPGAVCGEADYAAVGVCFNAEVQCPKACASEGIECGMTVWTGLWEPSDCECGPCSAGLDCTPDFKCCPKDESGHFDKQCFGVARFQEPCASDDDCGHLLVCLGPQSGGEKRCTQWCIEDCPGTLECQAAESGMELVWACFEPACQPLCDGKECGEDGCGGTCGGPCPCNTECGLSGMCQDLCEPACEGKMCGDGGCGCPDLCGTCPEGTTCTPEGQCE